jgi:magnesium chelatase accessory protein
MTLTTDLSRIPTHWPNRQFSQSMKLSGINWHFQLSRHENPEAKSILFIHGTGASTHSWVNIFNHLKANHTVLAVDLPGHGFSRCTQKSQLHIDEISKQLKLLLDNLEIPSPNIIVGHSAGTNCALSLSLLLAKPPEVIIGFNPSLVSPPSSLLFFLGPLINPLMTSGLTASFLAASIPKTNMINKLLDSTNSILSEQQREPYRYLFKEQSHIYGSMNFMAASDIPLLLTKSALIQTQFVFVVGKQDQWVKQSALMPILDKYFPEATNYLEEGGHLLPEVSTNRSIEIIEKTIQQLAT